MGNEDVNIEMESNRERKAYQTAHYRHKSGNCKAAFISSTEGNFPQQHWLRYNQNHAHIYFYCKN